MTEVGQDVILWSFIYIGVLLFIGWMGLRAKKEDTLSDHFLGGRSLGFLVLLLTLFATQYSGNALSAFPGRAYERGFTFFMCVPYMVGIVMGYVFFAPKLFRLSRTHKFVTPSDFIRHRFQSKGLHILSLVIFIFVLCNFLLAQLKAMGNAFTGIAGDNVENVYVYAVIISAAVILVYELLGGMRAVSWTDALQGTVMFVGFAALVVVIHHSVGSPKAILTQVAEISPEKIASPDLQGCLKWLSTFLLLTFGAPLYPQAIQRIYAAQSGKSLRRAMAVMAFLPLFAVTAVVWIGITGIMLIPNMERPDEVTFRVLAHLIGLNESAYIPVVIVMLAAISTIMSTADSCLLSLTSTIAKDVQPQQGSEESAEKNTKWVPLYSVGIMVLLGTGAILMQDVTLWSILELKFETLIQISPAFVLGTLHNRDHPRAFNAQDILRGLVTGLAIAVGLYVLGHKLVGGAVHAGLIGVMANYAVVTVSRHSRLSRVC